MLAIRAALTFALAPAAVANNPAPSVTAALLEAGADSAARDENGMAPFDYARGNEALRGSDACWRLNEGRFG